MTVPFTNVSGSTSITASEFSLPANTTTAVPTSQTTAFKKGFLILDRVGSTIAGDQFNAVIYEKVAGGTQRPIATFALIGATTELDVFELPALGEGWDITLKRISSTNRTIGWSIREDIGDANAATAGAAAVTSIQSGLATAAAVAGVQSDTDDIQSRLPATLDGSGNMRAQVKGMDASTITSTVVTSSGLATSSALSTLQTTANGIKAKTDNLPAAPASQGDVTSSTSTITTAITTAQNALAAAIAALPTASQTAIAVLASTVDGTDTLAQAIAIMLAEVAGNGTIDETSDPKTYAFKGKDGTTTRLAGTISGTARTVTTRNGA
jgi:hypothetical protein